MELKLVAAVSVLLSLFLLPECRHLMMPVASPGIGTHVYK